MHDIHDFEVDINVELNTNSNIDGPGSGVHRSASTPLVSSHSKESMSTNNASQKNGERPKHRLLDLQEYKRRRGLI